MDVSAGSSSMDWDGRGRDGNRVAAGVYFARIVDEGKAHTTKMMMLK
jgi:flagellar hook assembly protein FlgD